MGLSNTTRSGKKLESVATLKLSKISNHELLSRMDQLVHSERKITHLILCHINEVEARRLYAELGFDSMFKYLTKHCGYGEDSAYRRLQASRLLKKTPGISEKLEDGSLNLTQLTQVQKYLKQEIKAGNKVDGTQTLQILEQIQNKSSYETQKVLAVEFNQPIQVHQVIKPQRDESVRLELTLNAEQMKELSEAKDLLSHILPEGSLVEVITYLAKNYNKKIKGKVDQKKSGELDELTIKNKEEIDKNSDLIEKNSEANEKHIRVTHDFMVKRKRAFIKTTDRRKLLLRANQCCEYVHLETNQKCQSTYQLQIDHKIPIARGGTDLPENLRVLCRTHNLLAARQWGLS